MSKKPSPNPKRDTQFAANGNQKVAWKGYVNFTLTDVMKSGYQKFMADIDSVDDLIHKVLSDEYDLKVRHDKKNDCYSAQLYCTNANNPNAGWCLSIRGADWWKAVTRLLYVHYIALEEAWTVQGEAGWNDDQW